MGERARFTVWWDDEEGIVRNKSWGDFEERSAGEQVAVFLDLFRKRLDAVLVFNDLTAAGKTSSKARKLFADLMKQKRIKKQAFVGMKTMTRVVVSFIMSFSCVKNARYFQSPEEVFQWLNEGRWHGPI